MFLRIVIGLCSFLTFTSSLFAEEAPVSTKAANTHLTILSDARSIKPGDVFWVGLHFQMEPEWHVYWKNPGDSGMAPVIHWTLPQNIAPGDIQWPYPTRINLGPLSSYGYEGHVTLISQFKALPGLAQGEPVGIEAHVQWLACRIECVPGDASVKLIVPVGETQDADFLSQQLILEAKRRTPTIKTGWRVEAQNNQETLTLRLFAPQGALSSMPSLEFFPDSDRLIDHAAAQVVVSAQKGAVIKVPLSNLYQNDLNRVQGVLVADQPWNEDGALGWAIDVPWKTAQPLDQFILAICFAFLGGLILNLMPCVLPVLSIKILSLIDQAHKDPRAIRKEGWLFTAGIVNAFWVLACVLIIFKLLGQKAGWGFQFQSPYFVMAMAYVFFWFGLNLYGAFEIGTSLDQVSSRLTKMFGFENSYINGVLATIVATPCTAPFMGTALGLALTMPLWAAFLVFTSLGLGLAAPYIAVTHIPHLLKRIPKPGAWMGALKKIFSVLFFLTALWLAWVLAQQKGAMITLALFIGFSLLTVSSLFIRRTMWVLGGIALAAAVPVAAMHLFPPQETLKAPVEAGLLWEPYSIEKVRELRQRGPVFVDFTASWCLSCQVNERIALKDKRVEDAFKKYGIYAVKADWTNYDEDITQALEDLGKTSIPFYILYVPGEDPVIFPEILTPGLVLRYLEKSLNR